MELKELVERYQTAINQIYRRINIILKDNMHADITTDQFSTLQYIFKNKTCTSTDIASEFGVGKSAVTAQINRLFDKGLIERKRDDTDRRIIYLFVTAKGEELVHFIEKELFEVIGNYLKHFKKEEVYTFIHSLERLANLMNEG